MKNVEPSGILTYQAPDRLQRHLGLYYYVASDAIPPSSHPCSHYFSTITSIIDGVLEITTEIWFQI